MEVGVKCEVCLMWVPHDRLDPTPWPVPLSRPTYTGRGGGGGGRGKGVSAAEWQVRDTPGLGNVRSGVCSGWIFSLCFC